MQENLRPYTASSGHLLHISSLNGGFPTIQCGSLDWWTSEKFGRRREMVSTERRLSDARPGREARRCEQQPGPKNIYSSDEQRETSDEQEATGDERGKRGGGRAISGRRTSGDGGDRGERRSDEGQSRRVTSNERGKRRARNKASSELPRSAIKMQRGSQTTSDERRARRATSEGE